MSAQDYTWIVVADGRAARVFEERVRHGPLTELDDHALSQSDDDRRHAKHASATAGQRSGSARHNVNEDNPHDAAETKFLRRTAARVDQAAADGAFSRLVLIAPPRALGELKAALKPSTAHLVALTDPHERTGEDARAIKARLHELRTP